MHKDERSTKSKFSYRRIVSVQW